MKIKHPNVLKVCMYFEDVLGIGELKC